MWFLATVLAFAAAAFTQTDATDQVSASTANATTTTIERRLETRAVGDVAACYAPFHNWEYPLTGGGVNIPALRAAIDEDFRLLSKHVTHVRTYYSMHYGIEVTPIAAKYGLKLYLGVFLTNEGWGKDETAAAVRAIQAHPDTVEVVTVGNENLAQGPGRSREILAKVNEIKRLAGASAGRVQFGTVQRVTEYVDDKFNGDLQQLNQQLDILGVNIYPFFSSGYRGDRPTDNLNDLWERVARRYPRHKLRLTETGLPTGGRPASSSPNVQLNLENAVGYYEGLVRWTPRDGAGLPKFWFQAFDRRPEDPMCQQADYEQYFGFFTTNRRYKREGFPRTRAMGIVDPSPGFCGVERDVDYLGNDLGSALSGSAEGCVGICQSRPGCGAYTWSTWNQGTCWLKSSRGATLPGRPGLVSGVPCACDRLEADVDYVGADIGNVIAREPSSCFAVCRSTPGCRAFSWSNYDNGRCWLKSERVQAIASSGVSSGLLC